MIVTASKLRANIYNVLDEVLETGVPVEIHRRGKTLKIISVGTLSKLSNMKKHDVLIAAPDDIVHMDWSDQWKN